MLLPSSPSRRESTSTLPPRDRSAFGARATPPAREGAAPGDVPDTGPRRRCVREAGNAAAVVLLLLLLGHDGVVVEGEKAGEEVAGGGEVGYFVGEMVVVAWG